MEVSGRKYDEEANASAEDYRLYCEPCDGEGERIKADGYCKHCREYLCKSCIKFHRRNKQSKLHDVLEGDSMPNTRPPTGHGDSKLNEMCQVHNKPIMFYCQGHDDIGCEDCMTLSHPTCKADYIEDASKGFKDSREFKDLLNAIDMVEKSIRESEENIKKASKSNTGSKQTAIVNMRTYFKEREQELVAKIEAMNTDDEKLLADTTTQNEDAKKRIDEIKREIQTNREEEKHLFVSAKRRKFELVLLKKFVSDSTKEVKSGRRHYAFNRDDMVIGEIMASNIPLGTSTAWSTLNLARANYIGCNNIVIRTSDDKDACSISGIEVLTPGMLVLADWRNNAVKILDTTTDKVINRLQLLFPPWDLTILPDSQIAVTMYQEQKIQILAVNNNTLSKLREFKVSAQCRGIDYKLGKLAVSYFSPAKVEIMDTNGVVSQVINYNETNKIRGADSYVTFTNTGQEVFVPCEDKSVKKMSLQGHVLASYCVGALGYPEQIAVTGAGGVLVCDWNNRTILVCDVYEKLLIRLSHLDGLFHPWSFCVSEGKTTMMYIGSENNVLQTFKLQ